MSDDPDIPNQRDGETDDQFVARRLREIEAERQRALQQPAPVE